MSAGLITRTEDTPYFLQGIRLSRHSESGGRASSRVRWQRTRLAARSRPDYRPGADCAVQGRKAQKRPTRLFGGWSTPGCRSVTGDGFDQPNRRATTM